ncbi:MAG: hypothetical protein IPK32_03415 [Verrucomicrobiaceae bacterium]|nr:hypothetical protein [Verrucomicrobiaceae bacterium]
MNLTLHHSLKDLRWLWPRVVVLLAALVFDYAVQMEWLWPMSSRPTISFPAALWSVPMWIIAWWVLLSVPPEDGGLAFRSTRPVSRLHYWLSRILTGAVAVMLPMVIENAAVLLAYGRPWADVGRGVLETGLAVAVSMLWLLPAGTLFRGWEKYVALVLFIYCGFDGGPTWIFKWLHMPYREAWMFMWYDSSLTLRSSAIAGVLVLLFAFLHSRRPIGRLMRLAVPVVMGMIWTLPAMFPSFPSAIEAAQDEALVKKLTQDRVVRVEADRVVVNKGGKGLELKTRIEFGELPPGIVPVWQVEKRRMMQDGKELPDLAEVRLDSFSDATDIAYLPFWKPLVDHVPGAWAADTLTNARLDGRTRLATLSLKVDALKPITMELELSAQWARLRELGRMPLKNGAVIRTPQSEIEVLEVIAGMDNRGNERRVALTLKLRERHVTFGRRNAVFPFMPHLCLYAPEKRLLWQQASDGARFERGTNHGWSTFHREITFLYGVLELGTGVTKENLEQQELIWIGGEFLGSSRHEVKVENVVLGEQWREKDQWPKMPVSLTPKNPREAFLEHVKSIPQPAETATKAEVERYIAAVYAADVVFEHREDLDGNHEPKWPGNDLEVAEIVAPYVVRVPEVLSRSSKKGMSGVHGFIDCVMGEALLLKKVPGVTREKGEVYALYAAGRTDPVNPEIRHGKQWPLRLAFAGTVEKQIEAVQTCLRSGSDEALWSLEVKPAISDEEAWGDFQKRLGSVHLRYLSQRSGYQERVAALTREAFSALPRVTQPEQHQRGILEAAVALGDVNALDRILRGLALLESQDHEENQRLESAHSAIFGLSEEKTNYKTLKQFGQRCQHLSVKDFRYDAEKMRWELNAEAKP